MYSFLPSSKYNHSRTDPLPPDRRQARTISNRELRQTTFVLTSLRNDLKKEKRRAEGAEREIVQLQAKLARREAELENCIIHTGHSPPPQDSKAPPLKATGAGYSQKNTSIAKDAKILASSLTREDIQRLSEIAISRNRSLELEVRAANEKVCIL